MSGQAHAPDPQRPEAYRTLARCVLFAAGDHADAAAIASAVALDLPTNAAAPEAVLEAAGQLEDHALVVVDREAGRVTRTARGDAVAHVARSPARTMTLYVHHHYRDALAYRRADAFVCAVLDGDGAVWLPAVGRDALPDRYTPLADALPGDPVRIRPTDEGHGLAVAIHRVREDLLGADPAWDRAREVVGDGG